MTDSSVDKGEQSLLGLNFLEKHPIRYVNDLDHKFEVTNFVFIFQLQNLDLGKLPLSLTPLSYYEYLIVCVARVFPDDVIYRKDGVRVCKLTVWVVWMQRARIIALQELVVQAFSTLLVVESIQVSLHIVHHIFEHLILEDQLPFLDHYYGFLQALEHSL